MLTSVTIEKRNKLLIQTNQILSNLEHSCEFEPNKPTLYNGDSLFGGNLGLVVYHYYYYKVTKDERSKQKSMTLLNNIISRIEEGKSSLNNFRYSYGLCGFLCVLNHLHQEKFLDYDDRDFEEVISLSKEWILDATKRDDLEYMHGSFGSIFSLSNYLIAGSSSNYLDNLIDIVISKVKRTNQGSYLNMINNIVHDYPGCINLSLSHGLIGVILVFLKFFEKGLENDKAKNFVIESINFIINNLTPVDFENKKYCFSDIVIDPRNELKGNSRLAWCYGDLNIALVLLKAGKQFKNTKLIEIGNNIGLTSLRRKTYEETFIDKSQFCHGASGVAQLYNKFYELTGRDEYLIGYEYWLTKSINYLEKELNNNYFKNNENGGDLLEGISGTTLVLLSSLAKEKNQVLNWDSFFLVS